MKYQLTTTDWHGQQLPAVINTETGIVSKAMSSKFAARRCADLNRAETWPVIHLDSDMARHLREMHGVPVPPERPFRIESFAMLSPREAMGSTHYDTLEEAREAFGRAKEGALRNGGGYRIVDTKSRKTLDSFSHWVD